MAAKLLNLFDFYWFQHLIFSNKPPPPSPPPPAPHPDLQFYDPFKESNLSEHLPTLHVRSLGDADQFLSFQESFTLDNSVSPSSVLQASKLQRIFSAKELGEGYPTFDETDRPIERKVYGGRRRKGSRKSLSELELEEVKGFMDLGFVFSEEDKNSWLVSIVPGLKRLGRKSTSGGEDHDEEEDGENIEKSEVSRPYLSEAWAVLDRRRKEMDGLLNWRIPASANEMDMKDHLRLWAHTVASAVR